MVPARGKALVKTDLAIAVPSGTYGRVAPRSGLAAKNFIDTGAGVIDEDYRGELKVLLFNHSDVDFVGAARARAVSLSFNVVCGGVRRGAQAQAADDAPLLHPPTHTPAVKRGDRVAQLVLERILTPEVEEVESLDDTARGAGGFGSTGVSGAAK